MSRQAEKIQLPSYSVTTRDWLFAPRTFFTDSFSPFVEEISLPPVAIRSGSIKFELLHEAMASVSSRSIMKKLIQKLEAKLNVEDDVLLDLRDYSPANLAHAITIHLPITLYASDYLESNGYSKPLLIFPKKLPIYIQALFTDLGFRFLLTDNTVSGIVCSYNLEFLTCLKSGLPVLIKDSFLDSGIPDKLLAVHTHKPKKIFLSRKDTRRLSNEIEVEQFLLKKGYKKIYLEDFTITEQLALVSLADSIVAVHGAALAPLVFRSMFNKQPLKLVELFTPAHMTNVYRILTHQIGGQWIGVRGKAWPKLMEQAYECEQEKVRQYSLLDFEICLDSLELAMDKAEL